MSFTYGLTENDAYFLKDGTYAAGNVIEDFESVALGGLPPYWFTPDTGEWAVRGDHPHQGSKSLRYEATDYNHGHIYIDEPAYTPLPVPRSGVTIGGFFRLGSDENFGGLSYGVEQGTGDRYPPHYGAEIRADYGTARIYCHDPRDGFYFDTMAEKTIPYLCGDEWIHVEVEYGDPYHRARMDVLGENIHVNFRAWHPYDKYPHADGRGVGVISERREPSWYDHADNHADLLYLRGETV